MKFIDVKKKKNFLRLYYYYNLVQFIQSTIMWRFQCILGFYVIIKVCQHYVTFYFAN